jgi:hypothetical protein
MKKNILIFVALISVLILVLFLCKRKNKELQITGYLYKGEKIALRVDGNNLLNIVSTCDELISCSFNKKASFAQHSEDLVLHVKLDSFSLNKIDTFITIPLKYKMPVLSFQKASDASKRIVFLIDGEDERIVIP